MENPVIEISSGKLRGTIEKDVYSFKGIPYGDSTGGKNRFLPAMAPAPWTGIKEANQYGPACWQPTISTVLSRLLGASGINSLGEDCLALNVWTPGINDQQKRPVMVWLHGGGFFLCSGDHSPIFNGASLAKKGDVVVISVNHRLGVFGFLYLRELCGEKYAESGNVGMLDLVLALQWVRDNIATFGGDPQNVTIFGESGGGTKVGTLMAMPSARGLFHKAIIESGPGLKAQTPEEATSHAKAFLDALNIKPEESDILHELPASMILSAGDIAAPRGGPPPGSFSPVVDSIVLAAHPFDPVAPPTAADIPLLIGSNKDEMTFMLKDDPMFGKYDDTTMRKVIIESFKQRIGAQLPAENADRLIATYKKTRPAATPHDILIAVTSDLIRIGSIWLAERKTAGGTAPVFMYLFTWESPALGGSLKSPHTLELPFVFNNVGPDIEILGDFEGRYALANKMSNAWIAFARTGNPNHSGIPNWPVYTTENRATMIFDIECQIEEDPMGEERKVWIL